MKVIVVDCVEEMDFMNFNLDYSLLIDMETIETLNLVELDDEHLVVISAEITQRDVVINNC